MTCSVVFTHDDTVKKWGVTVTGAESELEVRQAFMAVILTCHSLHVNYVRNCRVTPLAEPNTYEISIPVEGLSA